ncbi:hypothetical protein [Persicirhabdus sediminis]|uniref:Uncharacterized protein n=1 Tax=Persicirhabdus sediminis TaxID=454144 RepID=A0A8J7SNR4_9BACT|nr:hypothetical protein [Persicirhabdus sediminis]MBK1791853.1 hypothetical protein [Persicirhabdus sediminis]
MDLDIISELKFDQLGDLNPNQKKLLEKLANQLFDYHLGRIEEQDWMRDEAIFKIVWNYAHDTKLAEAEAFFGSQE